MTDTPLECTCIPNTRVHSKTPVVATREGKVIWASGKTCEVHGYVVLGEISIYPVWKKILIPAHQAGVIAKLSAAGCQPKLLEKRRDSRTNQLEALIEFVQSYKREPPPEGFTEYFFNEEDSALHPR